MYSLMKLLISILSLLLLEACNFSNDYGKNLQSDPTKTPPNLAWEQNFEDTKNPDLERPTPENLPQIIQQINEHNTTEGVPGDINNQWIERGPNNIGGRTRAIMFDPNDPSAKKVWAGGVTGGLWYNNDITNPGSSWENAGNLWDNVSITAIAADPNNSSIFYVGTGEGWNQVASGAVGAGIWKTTDAGETWFQLGNTSSFEFINDLVVRDESGTSVVYAACDVFYIGGSFHGISSVGLQRSTNGGSSWTQVLPAIPGESAVHSPTDIEIDASNNLWVGARKSPFNTPNDDGGGDILFSSNGTTWSINYSHPTSSPGRVEIACAPSNSNYVYALIEENSALEAIVRTTNGGSSWSTRNEPADVDGGIPNTDFTRGQAWYNLILAVNPADEDEVIAGGIDLFRSTDGASGWTQISKWSNNNSLGSLTCSRVHADQHAIVFRPGASNEVIFGNDGGIFYCDDLSNAATQNTIQPRSNAYNVTQFYACASHPTAGSNYYLAGAQDNGTQQFTYTGMNSTTEATGGDGGFCFIDQTNPNYQVTAYTRNNFSYSIDNGSSFNTLSLGNGGRFINPADYDDNLDIVYSGNSTSQYNRIHLNGGSPVTQLINAPFGAEVSHLRVSPYTVATTTLFTGTTSGDLLKITNAQASPSTTNLDLDGELPTATISCIEIGASENELAVTFSNYGVTSVWYSNDQGLNWVSKEGNLPDMPVRWFIFNPNNRDEALVATELGVWATSNFNSGSPTWIPSNSGLARVRVDMLQLRNADQQVVAATHGRGLFTSNAFSEEAPIASFEAHCSNLSINMKTQLKNTSNGLVDSLYWSFTPPLVNFLNGTNANSENPEIAFTQNGNYQVNLYVANTFGNDSHSASNFFTVTNAKTVPYTQNFDAFSTCVVPGSCIYTCNLSDDWQNNTSDDTDWRVHTGSTPSVNTGPTSGFGGNGNYLYIEATPCRDAFAKLSSPAIDLHGVSNPQLSFAYQMYGDGYVENLDVLVCHEGGNELIWSNYGYTNASWHSISLDLSRYSGQKVSILFKGKSGGSGFTDIAIDEFSVSETNIIRWDNGGVSNNWTDADNWSTNQVPSATSKVVLDNTFVGGSYSISIDAEVDLYLLDIDCGANTISLAGANQLNCNGIVNPINGTLASDGRLTLKAVSETEYGQVSAGSGGITGNVVNQWYYHGTNGYRHLSSPVVCNIAEIENDFNRMVFSAGNDGSIWTWDASISDWDFPVDASVNFDQAFSIFMGTSHGAEFTPLPATLDAQGTLITGAQPQNLHFSAGIPAIFVDPLEFEGWNFVANPYPSYLDWDLVYGNAPMALQNVLSATVYYWDDNIGNDGTYASYNSLTNTSSLGGSEKIAKGQAFWLQLETDPNPTTHQIIMPLTDAMRSTEATPKTRKTSLVSDQISIKVEQKNGRDHLNFAVFNQATSGYDFKYDHLEMHNGKEELSLFMEDNKRRIAYNCVSEYKYPLYFSVQSPNSGSTKIHVKLTNESMSQKPKYLKDMESGKVVSIENLEFQFIHPGDSYTNQFALLSTLKEGDTGNNNPVVFGHNEELIISMHPNQVYKQATIFSLSGNLVKQVDLTSLEQRFPFNEKGVYLVVLQDEKGDVYSQKIALNPSL